MIVKTHLIPLKKEDSNKGSSGSICAYLAKEESLFFNQSQNDISKNDAIAIIDNHSKGRLGKNESKWYSPMYSFSQDECEHIVQILFNARYENYDDLNANQKNIYNNYIIFLARNFQSQMAKNFDKSELGINDGDDLVYVGVVENYRTYKSDSLNTIEDKGRFKNNVTKKDGFNTHIHIVQSRKANNIKQSKISPEAYFKLRTKDNFNNNSKAGFDRNKFYNSVEETFDNLTKFDRAFTNTFEYKKMIKNNKKQKTDMAQKKFYPKEEIDEITANSSLLDYFFNLADRGKLKFESKRGNDYVFNNLNQASGSISVSDKGWKDFSSGEGGQIIKAVMVYEKLTWIESVQYLQDNSGFRNYEFKNERVEQSIHVAQTKPKSDVEILKAESVTNPYIINYFKSRGISEDTIMGNVTQVRYLRNNKEYSSGGIQNIKGSYNVRAENFKAVIGEHNDISVIKGSVKSCIIFEGLVEYLSYLELTNQKKMDETAIILNSTSNFESTFLYIDDIKFDNIGLLTNKDIAGNKFANLLTDRYKDRINDYRDQFELSDKVDLNDRLIIEQIKDVSKKGYRI